jgi:N-acetylmuramoyl-L-alanine amidase
LEKRLGEIGARVILTRFKDENIPMGDRVSLINAAKPEMFISIHQNSFMIPGINGVEVYCYGKDAEAMRFGNILCENISRMGGIKNRGVRTGDYYLLRECRVSGVIIECMYMSGDKDGTKYNDETYEAIAGAIYESICSYYDIEP